MLIVSKFRDFYDTASIYGVDKTCVYKREEQSILIKEPQYSYNDKDRWPYVEHLQSRTAEYEAYKLLVGFCGEICPLIYFEKNKLEEFYFYDQESLSEFLAAEEIGERRKYWYSERDMRVTDSRAMNRFFDQDTWSGKFDKKFYDHNCPVFLYGRLDNQKLEITLNPCLKDIRFMTVKDPQTAYQDVYMYLSGVLGAPLPPKEKIDDKVMAASKGHDGEYSFKKPPGKRGKNRWR